LAVAASWLCSHFCIRERANDSRAARRYGFGQLRAYSASGEAGYRSAAATPGIPPHVIPVLGETLEKPLSKYTIGECAPAVHKLADRDAQPASDSAVIARSDDDDVPRPETQKSPLRPSPSSSWFLPWPGRIIYLSLARTCHLIVGIKCSSISARNPLVLSCLRGAVGQSQNGFVWAKAL
jgi:hypothetical protein